MLLSARMLNAVANVNTFEYASQAQWNQGDTLNVYFQLVDASLDRNASPSGRRYMPASGATLSVTLTNIDDDVQITRAATQAFPTSDPSIWYVSVLATDTISGTVGLKLALNQGGVITNGYLQSAILIPVAGGC